LPITIYVPLLDEITWPTGEYKQFGYMVGGNSSYPPLVVWPSLLTSIDSFDASNVRTFHASYEYDYDYNYNYARATRSEHGQNDLSYQATVIGYENFLNPITVTNINGLSTTFTFDYQRKDNAVNGTPRLIKVDGNAYGSCLASNATYTYDFLGYLNTAITEAGLTTDYDFANNQYDFDTIGLLDKVTYKNVDNGVDRVIDYHWYANRQLKGVTRPGLTVGYTYENGRIASRTETDTTVDPPGYVRIHARTRTWTYAYTYYGNDADGLHRIEQLLVTGPRGDQTIYRYSPTGNLTSIADALNHTVTFSEHNEFGLPRTMLDANGLTSSLQYDGRGRLTLLSTSGAVTQFAYNPENKLTRVTIPDGRYLDFTYSDSGRLSAVTNNVGEKVEIQSTAYPTFTQVVTKIFDRDGTTLHANLWRQYDALGRLWKMYDLGGVTGEIKYDAAGNPDTLIDGNNGVIRQLFDGLGRLKTVTDNRQDGVTTPIGYDNQDRLTSVDDPDGVTTTYHYDGFENLLQTSSPDTGTTTYQYDDGGNVKALIQANGTTIGYSYDLLNRLTFIDNPNLSNDVTYVYDETATNGNTNYGVGHLTTIKQNSGNSIKWIYDVQGKIVTDIRKIWSNTYTTGYAYDSVGAGKLTSMTYPSGNKYIIDTSVSSIVNGNVRAITLETPLTEIVKTVTYKPFGPTARFVYGNGRVYLATYDSLYRMDKLKIGTLNLDYGYDSRSLVEYIDDLSTAANRTEDFDYDPAGRLYTATGDYGQQTFLYSYAGDRLSTTSDLNGQVTNDSYTTEPGTHLLQEVVGDNPRSFTYNVDGRLVKDNDNDRVFVYDFNGRVTSVKVGGATIATYSYNPLGQRHGKTAEGVGHHFVYGLNGELIWEGLPDGSWQRDYVYLHDLLVAFVDTTASGINVYYVQADRLGTPQIVSNSAKVNVWKATYTPYGQANITLANIENNIRFPGQYYDNESGLHYNWHRYYDPSTGRYLTPDPIGLDGGMNLFVYAGGNPVMGTDPSGLFDATVNDTGGRNGATYGGMITVTGDCGQTVTVPGSSWPNPKNPNPGVATGTYPGTYSPTGHQGSYPGIRVNNGGNIPTIGPNPAQGGQRYANGINIHCGYSQTNRGSAGCITIQPNHCQAVWNVLQPGETGTITINR